MMNNSQGASSFFSGLSTLLGRPHPLLHNLSDTTGAFLFSGVTPGAYTVTISGLASGVACPTTTQAAVVTAGGTTTVSFACSEVRNSSIAVSVTGGSGPLAGVNVSLSGAGTGTQATNAGGSTTFSGLAAGSYTVSISGTPAGEICSVTSQSVSVPAGDSRSVSFTCVSSTTGTITGRLFLDENDKNNKYDGPFLEDDLAAADVAITLEGPTIGVRQTVQTDADGHFTFPELAAGQYNVIIDSDDPDIPSNVEYGLGTETVGPIVLAVGQPAEADFPFDIIEQTLRVFALLGTEDEPGMAPVEGVEITLYPTAQDAGALTNEFDVMETDETGMAVFTFDRADDDAPGGGTDNIVFARVTDTPPAHDLDADQQNPMEIEYDMRREDFTAPDAFDFSNRHVVMAVDLLGTGSMAPLEGWRVAFFRGTEDAPTGGAINTVLTDEDGRAEFERTDAAANMPEDYWFRLSTVQPAAGGSGWEVEAVGGAGEAVDDAVDPATPGIDQWLHFEHEGLVAEDDVADVGNFVLTFIETDVMVRVFHEIDDELGFTEGDNFGNATNVEVTLTWVEDGEEEDMTLSPAGGGQGVVTFLGVPTSSGPYMLSAEAVIDDLMVLEPTEFAIGVAGLGDLGGGTNATEVCPLDTDGECGTFAIKFTNGVIRGIIRDASLTVAAEGVEVWIRAADNTISPNPTDVVLTTTETGAYRLDDVTEGNYIVSVLGDVEDDDGNPIWTFDEDNLEEVEVDVEGNGDVAIVNFEAIRADTEIHGVVVNDRDADINTVDPGEALPDVTIRLYTDEDGDGNIDAADEQINETTTDFVGAYMFTGMLEGDYIVEAVQPAGAIVLTGYTNTGEVENTQAVTTTAIEPAAPTSDVNNARRVGNTSPPLPRWDYDNSTALRTGPSHFTYLFSTGIVQGTVWDDDSNTVGVEGLTVTIRLCDITAGSMSPAAPGTCAGSYFPGASTTSVVTDDDGVFSAAGLREGVYEVMPSPLSVPGFTGMTPTSRLYRIEGAADVETAVYRARP